MKRPIRLTAIASVFAMACGCAALGADLGTIGPTYPIEEADLLAVIRDRLLQKQQSGEIARLEREAREHATDKVKHPTPVEGVRATQSARTFYYDPTVTLGENVLDERGQVLFPAGTKKNPLEVVSMSKHLLFFDARDPAQMRKARELIRHYAGRVKPILVGGSFLDLMRAWQTPVYYDQNGVLVRQLGIRQVPALVSQDGLRLRIDELVVL